MPLSPGKEYERFVASLFHPNEFYIERGVNYFREHVLEVDGLFTDCRDVSMPRIVVECKTGAGFFRHLFKMGGQLSFLNFKRGYFFHRDAEKNAAIAGQVAGHFGITAFADAASPRIEPRLVADGHIRRLSEGFSQSWIDFYRLEDAYFQNISMLCGADGSKVARRAKTMLKKTNNEIWLERDQLERAWKLYDLYCDNREISREMAAEAHADFIAAIREDVVPGLQAVLFVQHKLRIVNVHYLALFLAEAEQNPQLYQRLQVPQGFRREGGRWLIGQFRDAPPPGFVAQANRLREHMEIMRKFPLFLQTLCNLFGGFLWLQQRDDEIRLLANHINDTEANVERMLLLIDRLYPLDGNESWFWTDNNRNISVLKFVPLQIHGVGVKLRRRFYSPEVLQTAHYFVRGRWASWEQRYDATILAFNDA
jgi:hypothetical protein